MSSTERSDLMPTQEKLEWVTPKISLMDAGDAEGKFVVEVETLMMKEVGPS
jgi:hypothetical protein